MHANNYIHTDNYIHVIETLSTSRCMASFDSEDFALLSNELLMFNIAFLGSTYQVVSHFCLNIKLCTF